MEQEKLLRQVEEIRQLLKEKHAIRGATLERQLQKGGRLLPRSVRAEASYLGQVGELAKNPKLLKMVDFEHADRAYESVKAHLFTINPLDRLWGRILSFLGSMALGLLALAAVALLVWLARS